MKKRVLTALLICLIVLPFVIMGGYFFSFGVVLAALYSYYEILELLKKSKVKIPLLNKILGAASLLLWVIMDKGASISYTDYTYQKIIISIILVVFPALFESDKYEFKSAFNLLGYILFLGIGFNLFINVRNTGLGNFLFLVCISVLTDTFAYLGGMFFGKHKLMPKVSPKKTVEGAVVGLVCGSILSLVFYAFFVGQINFRVVLFTFLLSICGQIGDLIFSKMKREVNIKDFSDLLPGHGGLLDRVDSFFVILYIYMLLVII